MAAPDFVTVGHAVRDLHAGGWRLGGTISFAAVQAHRLGLSVGVVTRVGGDVDLAKHMPFATIAAGVSRETAVAGLSLFPDAELAEHEVEHALGVDPPEKALHRPRSLTKMLGNELELAARHHGGRGRHLCMTGRHRIMVPRPGDQTGLLAKPA